MKRIYISVEAQKVASEIKYLFQILAINKNTKFVFAASEQDADHIIGLSDHHSITFSKKFLHLELNSGELNRDGFFELENGHPDYISTAFFCLNSLQEYNDPDPDSLGRFQYKNSYQKRLNNVHRNIVQECFNAMANQLGLAPYHHKTSFFLSHDIDTVYGAIKEDGFNVLKKGRFDLFFKMLFDIAMGRPAWLNIDKIMKIESEYDCRSVFYWIVNQGSLDKIQKNADYHFRSEQIQKYYKLVESKGFENGLHKSLTSESFEDEIQKFGKSPLGNRYHYLKFKLPDAYMLLESAGIKFDASLGFSEQHGFRNNYGLPFTPYNIQSRKPFNFVETPLHIMDRTFFQKRMNIQAVENAILDFFEKNREDVVISVLWHNNFFTEYKYNGYLKIYKKILAYIKEGNFACVSQKEIIQKFGTTWP